MNVEKHKQAVSLDTSQCHVSAWFGRQICNSALQKRQKQKKITLWRDVLVCVGVLVNMLLENKQSSTLNQVDKTI